MFILFENFAESTTASKTVFIALSVFGSYVGTYLYLRIIKFTLFSEWYYMCIVCSAFGGGLYAAIFTANPIYASISATVIAFLTARKIT